MTTNKQKLFIGQLFLGIVSIAISGVVAGVVGVDKTASAATPSPSPTVCSVVTPTPGAPFNSVNQFQGVTNAMLTTGSANPFPGTMQVSMTTLQTGIKTPTLVIIPATAATPCPTPTINNVNSAGSTVGQNALVTVWGTAAAFNSANFFITTPKGTANASTKAVTVSSIAAGLNYDSGITPPAIPSGYVGGYFLLPGADAGGDYDSLTFTATQPGDLFYSISVKVNALVTTGVNPSAAPTYFTKSGSTTIRPLLKFTTAANPVVAGTCSPAITVNTTDGNGVVVPVMTGNTQTSLGGSNAISASISGSPSTIFMDSACYYPTSALGIQNPPPAPGAGPKPPTIASNNGITFYYLTTQSEGFPIEVQYQYGGSGQMFDVIQKQTVNAQLPVAIELTTPSAVNQGACSTPITIYLNDEYGNEAPVQGSAKLLSLAPAPGATYYSDSGCSNPIQSVTIGVGQTTKTVYMRDTSSGKMTFSVADTAPNNVALQGTGKQIYISAVNTTPITSDPAVALTLAQALYNRLVGVPPHPGDANVAAMQAQILKGNMMAAAHIATGLDNFYNVTLVNTWLPPSNLLMNPLDQLNDFVTTMIGITRDGLDGRTALTGNFVYVPSSYATSDQSSCAQPQSFIYDNNHNQIQLGKTVDIYSDGTAMAAMQNNFVDLAKDLVPVRQCTYNSTDPSASAVLNPDPIGVVSSRSFMVSHGFEGTNRRLIRKIFANFMCMDITAVADNQMPDEHVRRDVDRAPGGQPSTYTATCRGCHAGMDALDGAFAFYDAYVPGNGQNAPTSGDYSSTNLRTFYINTAGAYGEDNCNGASPSVPKVNKNCTVYPAGYVTGDDSWINHFISNQNTILGWDPNTPLTGNGANALGNMFANSNQFAVCMAQTVFTNVCKRAPAGTDIPSVNNLANDFINNGYNFRRLFEMTATQSTCLPNNSYNGGN